MADTRDLQQTLNDLEGQKQIIKIAGNKLIESIPSISIGKARNVINNGKITGIIDENAKEVTSDTLIEFLKHGGENYDPATVAENGVFSETLAAIVLQVLSSLEYARESDADINNIILRCNEYLKNEGWYKQLESKPIVDDIVANFGAVVAAKNGAHAEGWSEGINTGVKLTNTYPIELTITSPAEINREPLSTDEGYVEKYEQLDIREHGFSKVTITPVTTEETGTISSLDETLEMIAPGDCVGMSKVYINVNKQKCLSTTGYDSLERINTALDLLMNFSYKDKNPKLSEQVEQLYNYRESLITICSDFIHLNPIANGIWDASMKVWDENDPGNSRLAKLADKYKYFNPDDPDHTNYDFINDQWYKQIPANSIIRGVISSNDANEWATLESKPVEGGKYLRLEDILSILKLITYSSNSSKKYNEDLELISTIK